MSADIETLSAEFAKVEPQAQRLRVALIHEIERLLEQRAITLGVPLESRVKTWQSIVEKLRRKSLEIERPTDLDDLVGLRIILLFRSDLSTVVDLLKTTFNVLSVEDTAQRLEESQFGYQSQHLVLTLPSNWSAIPSFSDLCSLKAEVQVRTVSQHIWAAASHKLQYKQESSVPPPLRRTIHRISALLETVDLELNRVLDERRAYAERAPTSASVSEHLNVDLLETALDKVFPQANKLPGEEAYSELLSELLYFGVNTPSQLERLFSKHMKNIMKEEQSYVENSEDHPGTTPQRSAKGVFFTHVGLARQGIIEEFGRPALEAYWQKAAQVKVTPPNPRRVGRAVAKKKA